MNTTAFVSEYVSRFGRMARPTRVTTIIGYMHKQLVDKQNYTKMMMILLCLKNITSLTKVSWSVSWQAKIQNIYLH
jgi:hypothetical protein